MSRFFGARVGRTRVRAVTLPEVTDLLPKTRMDQDGIAWNGPGTLVAYTVVAQGVAFSLYNGRDATSGTLIPLVVSPPVVGVRYVLEDPFLFYSLWLVRGHASQLIDFEVDS
jgi:hypothetical protein